MLFLGNCFRKVFRILRSDNLLRAVYFYAIFVDLDKKNNNNNNTSIRKTLENVILLLFSVQIMVKSNRIPTKQNKVQKMQKKWNTV